MATGDRWLVIGEGVSNEVIETGAALAKLVQGDTILANSVLTAALAQLYGHLLLFLEPIEQQCLEIMHSAQLCVIHGQYVSIGCNNFILD
ncbi:unnamed protein product [Pieris brassicae]|uniref:Uncharacterized protein n=1 Tax=Pieris brassicae TaxID=7116 RepID=A0A9P0TLH4_PIEBR|nr:unnamed protein product [Pieris brassicae]